MISRLAPGTPKARQAGCVCPPLTRGHHHAEYVVMTLVCPLHGTEVLDWRVASV